MLFDNFLKTGQCAANIMFIKSYMFIA